MPAAFDPLTILRVLDQHRVDHVVIGGLAAWLHGAPVITADIDVVFDSSPENVRRLVAALVELEAVYRDPLGRRITPDEAKLSSTTGGGHHLMATRAGDLDLLRDAAGFDYAALAGSAVRVDLGGLEARLAPLATIIELKRRAGRPKDVAALPVLEATLEDGET
ncbi:hypothetical protein L6R52_07100 [Myxococcota bacterium]|nr:hypothetical protein [Myxococcota bacterium]